MPVNLDPEFDHAGAGATRHHHVIECHTLKNWFAIAPDHTFQQTALFGFKFTDQYVRQQRQHPFLRNVGHETETTLINTNQRHIEGRQLARNAEYGAIATNHNRYIGMRTDFSDAHCLRARLLQLLCGFGVKHHAVPTGLQKTGQLAQYLRGIGCAVLANNGDGFKMASDWRGDGMRHARD